MVNVQKRFDIQLRIIYCTFLELYSKLINTSWRGGGALTTTSGQRGILTTTE
jgi:hypothetical protein